ncbi:MAG: phospholipase D-like domain-containing protein [Nanoarchaeota archaeon]
MKKILVIFGILFVLAFLFKDEANNLFTGKAVSDETDEKVMPQDFGNIYVYFCPLDDCEGILVREIENSNNVDCAFFDLNLDGVINVLKNKNYRLIVDDSNSKKVDLDNIVVDNRNGLMHNKFCVLDDFKVITGSMNPTEFDAKRNNNNLIIIESRSLVENYMDEFEEMWNGVFGGGEETRYSKVLFNGYLIENYFCPEDECEEQVLKVLRDARSRIYFMTFSFTSDKIGEEIVRNFYHGIDIRGVFEKTQAGSEYSEYHRFNDFEMDVKLDSNKGMMHHKVFIVDDIVIFGSYNPTKSGDEVNDENVLIFHSIEIAEKFIGEFERLYEESK